jgi:hypothetical protein
MKELRHYCRNVHCRTKLSEPTDNPKRAFCCRGCFNSFHRPRCVVCESPIRRKNERQRTCIDYRCKSALKQFPLAYSWHPTSNVRGALDLILLARKRHSAATDSGDRLPVPRFRHSLSRWPYLA